MGVGIMRVILPWPPTLASARSAQTALFEALGWMGGLVLVLMLAVAGLAYLRRRIRAAPPEATGLALGDLRRLRDEGRLSEAEYDRLRRRWSGLPPVDGVETRR